MSTQNEYILMFRGTDWHKGLSPEEMQQVASQMMDWFNRLTEQGRVTAGNPLGTEGKIISGKGGSVVADGPFAESKEAIGGYFLIRADSLDEAVEIAKECPGLNYNGRVEVRPILEKCPFETSTVEKAELAEVGA